MTRTNRMFAIAASVAVAAAAMGAQATPHDPSARLKEVLPAAVADHVLSVIAAARAHDLPAAALENRALKFAAKGVDPKEIERSVVEQSQRMQVAKDAIDHARVQKASGDEVEAAAEVMRKGVDGSKVSALAKSAPSGRSLAVPLYVIGNLMDRGLPSDSALRRVEERLAAKASNADLEKIGNDLPAQANGQANGHDNAQSNKPAWAGNGNGNSNGNKPSAEPVAGPPAGVPANPGAGARATPPAKPPVPPGSKKP